MLAALLSHSAGVILNRTVGLGVLNAQLVHTTCKAIRQLHSYHSCLGDVHRRIVLNDLCITIVAQLNVISRSSSRSYNTVLRSDLQRQRFVCRIIRGRLNLQRGLNVQLLVAVSHINVFEQFFSLIFVNFLCFINSSRAEGRYCNRLSSIFNFRLVAFGNFIAYIDFRLGNIRLDLNRTGDGLCNYLVVITGFVTGCCNIAVCNKVCACTLSLVVGRVKVCKIATLNSNLSSAIFISRIYAVNNEVITIRVCSCFCIKIAIIDGQFACLYLYRSATTVVFTAINGQLCFVYIDCIATILTCINTTGCCFKCGICSNIQCNKVCVVIAHVVRTVNGMLIKIQSDGHSNHQTCIIRISTISVNIGQ